MPNMSVGRILIISQSGIARITESYLPPATLIFRFYGSVLKPAPIITFPIAMP